MDKVTPYLEKAKQYLLDNYISKGRSGQAKLALIGFGVYYAAYVILKTNGLLPKKSVVGKHVFITGAGSGIGKQMAIRFLKLGAKVTLADVNLQAITDLHQNLNSSYPGRVHYVRCDVSSVQSVKEAAQSSVVKLGLVDILINNAGIVTGKKILQNTEQGIEKSLAVNTTSHHWTVREFLPSMIHRNSGHIVSIASMAGLVGVNGLADYCASKFGAVGFNESLRFELRYLGSDVKTTTICPYYINTGMFDGVRTRFPLLFPILSEKYATDRIMWAILQEESMMIMPFAGVLGYMLKGILPVCVFDRFMEIMGVSHSMDHFQGRQQQL